VYGVEKYPVIPATEAVFTMADLPAFFNKGAQHLMPKNVPVVLTENKGDRYEKKV
jgi:hypothetical protein